MGGLALAVALGVGGAAGCSAGDPAPGPPARACGLRVWHHPASPEAHVEIVGDWDGWTRPGTIPDATDDGWRVASFDPPPGEHAYAIVEDGVWLADRNVPMTAFHDGEEVALAVVPDCGVPALRVDGVEAVEAPAGAASPADPATAAAGRATIRATFLAAASGAPLDPSTVSATPRDPSAPALAVTAADPATGELRLEASGLKRGKYIYTLHARDRDGKDADEAVATVWIEPEPWDPSDAIVYQVMIDRFRGPNGPLAPPPTPGGRAGGTLSGVRAALEAGELEALGVNTLWLSPLYKNPEGEFPGTDGRAYTSYHGYWPTASRELDPRLATEAELDDFMRAAHARSMRVLFDVVPNHVHEQHPWVKEHPDWFKSDCVCGQGTCDWASHIKTCWFAPYLPDLDWTNSEAARAETNEVMWWFDRWGADGLRIDAVPMMPRAATRRIMTAVRARYEHPGNVPYVLGENFTGPGGYQSLRYDLGPFGLDGSFNFPLMWSLRSVLAAETAPMSDLDASYRAGVAAWDGSGAVMGQMIDNHDVARFASAAAGSDSGDAWSAAPQPLEPTVYAKQRLALATVLTLPGAPVIYYGDEVGLAGRSDPDCRRVMPAEAELIPAQLETREVARKIGRARACSKALRRGALVTLLADAERFVFARTLPAAGAGDAADAEVAIVALARRPTTPVDVPLPPGAPAALVDVVTGERADASGGALHLDAEPLTPRVYVAAGSACASP
jgi:glycosidase